MKRAITLSVILVALLVVAGCGSSEPSDAEAWSKNVHVTLDVTTDAQVFEQMPTDRTFTGELNASGQRVETWTFDDGSKIIFAYEAGPPGGGLVLSWVKIED